MEYKPMGMGNLVRGDPMTRAAIIAAGAIILTMLMYWDTGTLWRNQYDDSFISFRYAVNLSQGHGLVFNEGERADAASSFLFTVVLAIVHRIGFHDMEMTAFLINMLSIGCIAAFVYLCAVGLGVQWMIAALLGLIASLHGFLSGWAILGMETATFAALLCGTAWAVMERRDNLATVMVIAVCLTRPEGLLIVPFAWWGSDRSIKRLAWVVGFLVLYYLARFAYYGSIVSTAVQAKNLMVYYSANPMQIALTWYHFALVAPIIALIGSIIEKRVRWLVMFIALFAAVCLVGPRSDYVRYSVPLLPLMIIAGAPLLRRWQFAPIVCAILLYHGYGSITWMHSKIASAAPVQFAREETGKWLQANTKPGEYVLSGDLGAISYFAPDMRFIDVFGLTSADVLSEYKARRSADAVIRVKRPAYIADTMNIEGGRIVWTHANGAYLKHPACITALNNESMRVMQGTRVSKDMAIAVIRIGGE